MSQPTTGTVAGPKRRPWWSRRRVVLPALLLVAPFALYFAADRLLWLGTERRYRAAAAEADRLDPGWRDALKEASPRPIPDEENSALIVLKAAMAIPANWSALNGEWIPYKIDPAKRLPSDVEEAFRHRRDEVTSALADARSLADHPLGRFPGRVSELPRGVPDSRQAAEKVAGLLHLDALLRIQEGDFDGALVDVRAMINAGRSLGDDPLLASQAGRVTPIVAAVATLERLLAQGEVPGPALKRLQDLLEDEAKFPLGLLCLRGERAGQERRMEQIRAGEADISALFERPVHPILRSFLTWRNLRENQAEALEISNRLVELARENPDHPFPKVRGVELEWRVRNWDGVSMPRKVLHFPAFQMIQGSFVVQLWQTRHLVHLRLAILALAAERFRIDRGRWPDGPEELVPAYLTAIPADPCAAGPLRWKCLEHGLIVYSVGYDGIDQGGSHSLSDPFLNGGDPAFPLDDPEVRGRPAESKR